MPSFLPTTCILPKHPMQFGDFIKFHGKCVDPKNGSSFSVNLMRADDIMCCVDFRPLDNKVVLNDCSGGCWGQEIHCPCPEFRTNEQFEVKVTCSLECYQIFVDGKDIGAVFPYRTGLEMVTNIKTVVDGPPNNVEWLSARQIDARRLSRLLPNTKVLSERLEVGDKIIAYGKYADGNIKFSVNLMNLGEPLLHVDFRPPSMVVMNNQVSGKWGEEIHAPCPVFIDNEQFSVRIVCTLTAYKIFFNDRDIGVTFPYRQPIADANRIRVIVDGKVGNFEWLSVECKRGCDEQ